uniref:Methylenetetrahydrofolate reductase (NAD(P)H) n=1 Tax=Fervidicoccus fontis TaxID=683846 RepID=A0A7J3ZK57_9CREN
MRLLLEIQPSRNRDKLRRVLVRAGECFDEVFIPDSPMGYPKASTLSIASLAVELGLKATISIRVIDYSWTGLVNQIYGAKIVGVKGILFLRGDAPVRGSIVNDLTPEQALRLLKSDARLKDIEGGLTLSMRFPLDKILERVRENADFYVVLRKSREKVEQVASVTNSKLIGYAIVVIEENRDFVLSNFAHEDVVFINELKRHLEEWSPPLEALIISAPRAIEKTVEFVQRNSLCI